jgi:hypothetical protein
MKNNKSADMAEQQAFVPDMLKQDGSRKPRSREPLRSSSA